MKSADIPVPTSLTLKKRSRQLAVEFADGISAALSAELLRVYSPSAEVTGHSPSEARLVTGKELVGIIRIEPVGRYAVRIVFDDGHDSGLYTWKLLYELSTEHDERWQRYLERLREAGHERANLQ